MNQHRNRLFFDYIEERLIPDLKEAGNIETAKDIERLLDIAKTKTEALWDCIGEKQKYERRYENSKKALKKYYDVHSQLNELVQKMQGF